MDTIQVCRVASGSLGAVAVSYYPEVHVGMIRHRQWFVAAMCVVIAVALLCWFCLKSKSCPDEKTVSAAEDEVYEAVVHDMITPTHVQANTTQLVFDDTVLTDLAPGADKKSCEESVRKRLGSADNTTPLYNSLADRVYRVLTRGWVDGSLRADTIQDFLEKSCSAGRLSTTFHTDLPRVFIKPDSVYIDIVPIQENGQKDFAKVFPGASGIISLSHVGFDPTLREAIVSSSFVCGMLCGEGRRHILRKTRGRWVVVQSLVVWVS